MAGPVEVIMTDKWATGYAHEQDLTLLLFEFSDRPPINLAISRENAGKIAEAILAQLKSPPPQQGQMN